MLKITGWNSQTKGWYNLGQKIRPKKNKERRKQQGRLGLVINLNNHNPYKGEDGTLLKSNWGGGGHLNLEMDG